MSVCRSPGRPRDVSLATEGLGCRRTPPLPRQCDGPDGERGIPDASGSDRGRPHSVPRKITSSFQSRSGEKTSHHLFDHKPERGPRPPLTSAGACGAPHRRPRPLFGGVKAMPKPRETRSKCQLRSASLPCAPDAMSPGRDETLADQDQTKKDPLPRMRLPSAASREQGLVVVEEREVWEVDGIGEEGGGRRPRIGRARFSHSPIPAFSLLFPWAPLALSLPHMSCCAHPIRRFPSSARSPAAGGWLVARGSWTPFVFLSVSVCSTAAAVALTRAARDMGRPTDTPPNSGAFPRLTRFDEGRDGVLGSIVQTRSPSIQRQTVRRPGKEVGRRQPSCNREAPNDRGNETCGGKGSGERGVLVGRQRSPGPGLVMSSRYMLRGISHWPGARLPS